MDPLWLAVPGCIIWAAILAAPWRPWSSRPSFDAEPPHSPPDLGDVTVLIPARNESAGIACTLRAAAGQGQNLRIVLVDDQSTDGTADAARAADVAGLTVVHGAALPAGWTGKLWALEQGLHHVETPLVLQLDADIELLPGTIAGLRARLLGHDLALVSLMARLRMENAWERVLMPAFVFFFRLLYPFRVANSRSRFVAAAAGGCILVRTGVLRQLGGFAALRGALIDDCTLARRIKDLGYRTWIGLTRSAISHRVYPALGSIWEMVTRTAYTQLRHSPLLLLLCTALMLAAFVAPLPALLLAGPARGIGATTLVLMCIGYLPTLRYYGLPPAWCLTLPVAGVLYLLMTWSSALRHWSGAGARWKERSYSKPTIG
jgi:hopene-associated glycosyltransferase HpnB